MLHGWDNFFMLAGTAAATLVGLLFVAITLAPTYLRRADLALEPS
jgi:hypothetical protein